MSQTRAGFHRVTSWGVSVVGDAADGFTGTAHHENPAALAFGPECDPLTVRRKCRLRIVVGRICGEVDRVLPTDALQIDV